MKTLPFPSTAVRAVHIFALWGFGVAQPIYQLMKGEPFWFAVQGYDGADVVLYALALLLVPPAALLLVELVAGALHPRASRIAHSCIFVVLGSVVLVGILKMLPWNYRLVLSLALAAFLERIYRGWQPARTFLTLSSLAPIFFVVLFLNKAPIAELSASTADIPTVAQIKSQAPVVVVIFDEFPVSSLMMDERRIDAVRYPNFARLSRSATWYPNATTVHDYTFWAVPAILTGRVPRNEQLPVLADHPENLFTLLGNSYRVHAFEPVTRLCPATSCPVAPVSTFERIQDAGTHLKRTFRLLLTRKYHAHVPDWIDPEAQLSRFLGTIKSSSERELYVLHVLLPHVPWHYAPDGTDIGHERRGVLADGRWASQQHAVHGYQRHLLQLGYVDRVLGEIIERLRGADLWTRSLVVVTADHGISFRPGEQERTVDAANLSDVSFVPLFIKTPAQERGFIDHGSARVVDIVPTIADVLGVRIPWRVDGHSLLAEDRPQSRIAVLSVFGDRITGTLNDLRADRDSTIARKTALFGTGHDLRLFSGLDERLAAGR
jgi:hypothetical protein